MKTKHRVIFGDARKMTQVPDGAARLIVTSPPYWQLKDYGTECQIGFDDTYEDYINNLNLVWLECSRVLHDGCRLCINIGDQFARSVYYGRYKVIPIRTEITRFCETIGFDYMGSVIWQKVTTCNTTGGATIMGSYPYPRNGIVKIDYEFILLFKKHGKPPVVTAATKKRSVLSKHEWGLFFNGHWNFSGEKQNGHIAMFPEELPRRLIKMFSFEGELVLDPFLGSGTTSLAAMNLGRNSVGYEINSDYSDVIKNKLSDGSNLFHQSDIEFAVDCHKATDEDADSLPYRFTDPLQFNRKIDPRKLNFGSTISKGDSLDVDAKYHLVREVLSVDRIRLSNDLVVRLLGVRPTDARMEEAMSFLKQKIVGKQVYLRYDKTRFDAQDTLMVYLYLRNRTFVNAHLIKHGYASVDPDTTITNKSILKLRG